MPAPLLLLAALAAAQPAAPPPRGAFVPPSGGHGRAFISPMGEPFHGGSTDGLVAWFQVADRNHDGSITLDELREDADRFYKTLDTNHDGEIDPDEIEHYETVVAPEVRSNGASFDGEDVDDEATGAGRLGLLTVPEPVTAADSNLDRGVSEQEFQTAAEKRFALLDRNGDGRLTLDELQAERSAIRSNARRPRRAPNTRPEMPTSDVPQMGGPGG